MISKNILKQCHKNGFDNEEIYDAYKIFFGTLFSEPRLRIINFLRVGKKNVSDIMCHLNMNQTAVSHNLARLKQCGFVTQKVEGKYRYYSLNDETIRPLMSLIDKHMRGYCIHILHRVKGEESHGK